MPQLFRDRLSRGLMAAGMLAALGFIPEARAEDAAYALVIKDHRFTPDRIEVPAGVKVRLTVSNQDTTAEEFDSASLNREKVIAAGGQATILVGPLDPGTYDFMGEYHSDTAKGQIVAK